jgi:hypothetical protein
MQEQNMFEYQRAQQKSRNVCLQLVRDVCKTLVKRQTLKEKSVEIFGLFLGSRET